jgi:tetratricopeptide (TPR) repeat protein
LEATHRSEEVVRTRLARALARYGDSPLAGQGWLNLADLVAMQRDLAPARECYERALDVLWDDESRARAYYGRAKTFLESGRPELALPDYRHSLKFARAPRQRALAHWGLGVALERSGNLNAALSEIERATSIQVHSTAFIIKTVLDLPDVHFLPEYDREYYKALAALAAADASDVPSQARLDYESTIALFDRYLGRAEVEGAPWVRNAKALKQLSLARIRAIERSSETSADE